jgi:hypothetical protein
MGLSDLTQPQTPSKPEQFVTNPETITGDLYRVHIKKNYNSTKRKYDLDDIVYCLVIEDTNGQPNHKVLRISDTNTLQILSVDNVIDIYEIHIILQNRTASFAESLGKRTVTNPHNLPILTPPSRSMWQQGGAPKPTLKRITLNGRPRIVYVGPRGGEYIRKHGTFIRVSKK